jgi:hypothetical protein
MVKLIIHYGIKSYKTRTSEKFPKPMSHLKTPLAHGKCISEVVD